MLGLEDWKMIRELKKSGLNITEISKRLGVDRKTVRSQLDKDKPSRYIRKKSKSIIDEHSKYIDQRLELYNLTSQKIFEEITQQGFKGQYGIVNKYVQKKKAHYKTSAVQRFETIPGEQAQDYWGYFGEFYVSHQNHTYPILLFHKYSHANVRPY